jgi:hypothetical protein
LIDGTGSNLDCGPQIQMHSMRSTETEKVEMLKVFLEQEQKIFPMSFRVLGRVDRAALHDEELLYYTV